MQKRVFPILALLMIIVLAFPGAAFAAPAAGSYAVTFTTAITYQNVGGGAAHISIDFYDQGTGSLVTTYTPADLAKNAGASFSVGSVSNVSSGFKGSAVMSSDQPLIATLVQVPDTAQSAVKNRPLSNAFSEGSGTVLLATVLKNKFDTNSVISIQNVDTESNDITVNFYNADNPAAAPIVQTATVASGAAKYYDLGSSATSYLPSGFNGSATVTAVRTASTSTAGKIVGSVMELHVSGAGADAFEGVATGDTTFYMAIASCQFGGVQTSTYAIQNSGTAVAHVTITYDNGKTDTVDIDPGKKASMGTCRVQAPGYKGASTITTTTSQIIAIGKVTGGSLSTAFVGTPGSSGGADTIAVPYVRWSQANYTNGKYQRAYIAIQNIGGALNAGDVKVTYVDKNGNTVGVKDMPAIASGSKVNSNAYDLGLPGAEFGNPTASSPGFGGSAIITGPAGSKLVVICRIQSKLADGSEVAEDYNGVPFVAQ